MPLISVIVPVYNVEMYLKRCIDSILAQTFSDFELILVDDGSTDDSGAICDEYSIIDRRIRVFHQENKGQSVARNLAINIAKGEYISFVDSDDYIHPRMFEFLVQKTLCLSPDIVVFKYCEGIESNYKWIDLDDFNLCINQFEGKAFLRQCILQKINKCWILCDKIFKRSCFDNIRLPEGRIFEDNSVVYKILYNADNIIDCNVDLYYYFTNENSTVNKKFELKHLDWLIVLQEMIVFFTENKEQAMLDNISKRYMYELLAFYKKVKSELDSKVTEKELKKKLYLQFKIESKKYSINLQTAPEICMVLFPIRYKIHTFLCRVFNKCKNILKGIKNRCLYLK